MIQADAVTMKDRRKSFWYELQLQLQMICQIIA
jgi:hypothetical protein